MKSFLFLIQRDFLRFFRQKSRLIGALLTPLVFWFLLGGGISATGAQGFEGSKSYFEFFFPGVLMMSALFTAIFSAISMINDRNEGFFQAIWISPLSRINIVIAKNIGASLLSPFQCLLLCLIGVFFGLKIGLSGLFVLVIFLFLASFLISSLSILLAWKMNSVESFHSMMNLVLMPLWFLSGSFFPLKQDNMFFYWIGRLNPLSYLVNGVHKVFFNEQNFQLSAFSLMLYPLFFALVVNFFTITSMNRSSFEK